MKTKKSTRKFLKNSLQKTLKKKPFKKSFKKKDPRPHSQPEDVPDATELDAPDVDLDVEVDLDLDESGDESVDESVDDCSDSDVEDVQELEELEKIHNSILNSKENSQEKEASIKKFVSFFKRISKQEENAQEMTNVKAQEFIILGILQDKVLKEISKSKNSKKFLLEILKSFINLKKSDGIKLEMLLKISNLELLFKEISNLKDKSKKEVLKSLLKEFQIKEDITKEEISAFIITRFIAIKQPKLLDNIFKNFIKILESLRISNSRNLVKVKFINSCLVELAGLSLGNTCSLGFLGIRELALQLKGCLSTTDFQVIQTWAFINKIKIWALIISTYATPELLHLVYPLVQVSIGVLRLQINSRNFPLHLTLLQSLVELSEKTGVFIPISSYLMDILSHSEISGKAKPSTAKPLDLSVYLSVPSGYQGTTVYQKGLFESVLNLFYDYLAIPSISFPETSVPVTVFLKRWSKKSKNAYMSKNIRVLLEKIQEQSSWTEKERSGLNISPTDFKDAVDWTRKVQGSPLQSVCADPKKFVPLRNFLARFVMSQVTSSKLDSMTVEAVSIPSPNTNSSRFERRHSSLTTEKKILEEKFSKSQPKDHKMDLIRDDDSESLHFESQIALPLTPFKNQVGGHTSFLRFSEKALCKPLDKREREFYEALEQSKRLSELKPFVASYLGCVNVTFKEPISDWRLWVPVVNLDDNKHFLVDDPNVDLATDSFSSRASLNRKMQRQIFKEAWSPKSIRARYENVTQTQTALSKGRPSLGKDERDAEELSLLSGGSQASLFYSKSGVSKPLKASTETMGPIFPMDDDQVSILEKNLDESPDQEQFNPWSLHLYSNQVSKLAKNSAHQFLLLQDLTHGLEVPCILDLKMGTRQHGVMATPEKKESQERKCERSTSKRFGVRICGMQTYKNDTSTFSYLDKYVGRSIHAADFKISLLSFLDNGTHYLIGYIPQIIKKLLDLSAVIQELPKTRFYASSLLIIYDGSTFETDMDVQVKMIDFSNCVVNSDHLYDQNASIGHDGLAVRVNYPPTTKGPDQGYLLGLRTLIKTFEELYRELGGLENGSHVSKENVPKSARLVMEVGDLNSVNVNDVGGPTYADGTSPQISHSNPSIQSDPVEVGAFGQLKL